MTQALIFALVNGLHSIGCCRGLFLLYLPQCRLYVFQPFLRPGSFLPQIQQLPVPLLRQIKLQLQLRHLSRRLRHRTAAAPVWNQRAAFGSEYRDRLVIVSHIAAVFHEIAKLCLNRSCGQCSLLLHLGQIRTAFEGIGLQSEQFHTNVRRKTVGSPVRSQINQCKRISLWCAAEAAFNPVALSLIRKDKTSAETPAVPRGVFLTFTFFKSFCFSGKSVKHRADKFRQCGLSEPVRPVYGGDSRVEIQFKATETAEIFNV